MKKRLLIALMAFVLCWFSGLAFFGFVLAKPEKIHHSKPFIFSVTEIASDGENIYTLDDTFNYICKYSSSGEFQYAISFSSYGASNLYINEEGLLCRYDIKQDTTYIYDDFGEMIGTIDIPFEEFKEIRSTIPIKEVTVEETHYKYNKRLFFNSTVEITDNEKTESIVVEPFWEHLLRNTVVVVLITGFLFAMLQFATYFLKELERKR
jgi:hypothetical protein